MQAKKKTSNAPFAQLWRNRIIHVEHLIKLLLYE